MIQVLFLELICLLLITSLQSNAQELESAINDWTQQTMDPKDSTVYVYFEVSRKGEIQKVRALRVYCFECDERSKNLYRDQAETVIRNSPDWEPGRNKRGKPVRVKFVIPIRFSRTAPGGHDPCLSQFESALGFLQSDALTELTNEFVNNILTYPNQPRTEKFRSYFLPFANGEDVNPFPNLENKEELLATIRSSGLDTAIFNTREPDRIEGRELRSLELRTDSNYIKALRQLPDSCNSFIKEYLRAIDFSDGTLTPPILAKGPAEAFVESDYHDPMVLRILTVEFFLAFLLGTVDE